MVSSAARQAVPVGRPRRANGTFLPSDERYLNRELSWLAFDERVLALGEDPNLPLLERVKFLAIAASNLDEFFQVRVAGLKRQEGGRAWPAAIGGRADPFRAAGPDRRARPGALPSGWPGSIGELAPLLAGEGIRILRWTELDEGQARVLQAMFGTRIFPVLTPLAVDPGHPFPYISNLSLNLAIRVAGSGHAPDSLRARQDPATARSVRVARAWDLRPAGGRHRGQPGPTLPWHARPGAARLPRDAQCRPGGRRRRCRGPAGGIGRGDPAPADQPCRSPRDRGGDAARDAQPARARAAGWRGGHLHPARTAASGRPGRAAGPRSAGPQGPAVPGQNAAAAGQRPILGRRTSSPPCGPATCWCSIRTTHSARPWSG